MRKALSLSLSLSLSYADTQPPTTSQTSPPPAPSSALSPPPSPVWLYDKANKGEVRGWQCSSQDKQHQALKWLGFPPGVLAQCRATSTRSPALPLQREVLHNTISTVLSAGVNACFAREQRVVCTRGLARVVCVCVCVCVCVFV